MPELPEVETVRRQLEPVLVGQTLRAIEVLRDKSFQGDGTLVLHKEVVAVDRTAKVLQLKLEDGVVAQIPGSATGITRSQDRRLVYLLVHLKMTGQLIYQRTINNDQRSMKNGDERIVGGHPSNSWNNRLPDNHTRVILYFDRGVLFFNDMRVFGWVKAVEPKELKNEFRNFGPDIHTEKVTYKYFYEQLQRTSRPVKVAILDQKKFAGVGNIYANDGLYDAGIDPRRPAHSLSKKEADRLLDSLKKVVNLGIELGGATAADGKFVNTQGYGGSYQNHFLVYEREGDVVNKDGKQGVVKKIKVGGRGTYWVPNIQK